MSNPVSDTLNPIVTISSDGRIEYGAGYTAATAWQAITNRLARFEAVINSCCDALRIDADHSEVVKKQGETARLDLLRRTVARMQDHHKGHHDRDKHTRDVLERLLGWFISAGTDGFKNAGDGDADVGIMFIESALSNEPLPIMGETAYPFHQSALAVKRIRDLEGEVALLRAKLNETGKA